VISSYNEFGYFKITINVIKKQLNRAGRKQHHGANLVEQHISATLQN